MRWLLLTLCAFLPSLAGADATVACDPVGAAKPLCGFQNPEDLAPLPGGEALLVSEYGAMEGGKAGRLVLLTLASEERSVLYRGGAAAKPTAGWGDAACPGAPSEAFSPHGIDLAARPDGTLVLAVVQHGGRESIELFEVSGSGSEWAVDWRGCIVAPEDAWLNEVVLLSDGGLLTTHMMSRAAGIEQMQVESTEPTGWLYEWNASDGFREVPGTKGRMPNGLEVSADETTIFLNLTLEGAVRRIDRASGEATGSAAVASPDNTTWSPDAKELWVASLQPIDPEAFEECQKRERGACPLPFRIVAVDPASLETRVVFDGEGSPMGAGTVGLGVGDDLFVGSFSGDRVLRVDLAPGD